MTSKLLGYNDVSEVVVCSKSKYVYIPLIIGNDQDITVFVKKNDYVFKGSKIGKSKGEISTFIFSSVSGIVIGFEEKIDCSGNKIKCVKIENDYKEKKEAVRNYFNDLSKYSKEEFCNIIKKTGIIESCENILPIYTKYNSDYSLKTLIINCLEYKRYVVNNYFIIKNYVQQVLETIDFIVEINKMKECYIVIPKNDKTIKRIFNSFLGTYPKIKLFEINKIPRKNSERKIVKKIKKQKYIDNSYEIGTIYHKLETIYSIYEALKYNKVFISKRITIIANNNRIQVSNLKIGMPISELIDEQFRNHEIYLISGNVSIKINYINNFIVTSDLDGIVIL